MASAPASCDELERFTPAVLANVPAPPVFLLRPASGRELRQFEYRLMAEGLETHGADQFRAEMLKALQALWSPADFEPNAARLRSYWELLDQGGNPDPAESEHVSELTGRLIRAHRPLSKMAADNKRFADESGRIAISKFTVGWEGLDVSYTRESGAVPLERIDEVELALAGIEKKAKENRVEGVGEVGTAFMQLCTAAYLRLMLTKDQEKNSPSPPLSAAAPNGSTKRRSKPTGAARSKAPASSGSATA